MKHAFIILLLLPLARGGPRTSPDYVLAPETTGCGGGRVSSANYTLDMSLGTSGGATASADMLGKSGYAGQLYDVTGLLLGAIPASIDEGGSRQLTVQATLDDATALVPSATEVAWSVVAGPLTGIDPGGLASAGFVYQDTAATAKGDWSGVSGTLELTVLDSLPDNYGSYAGDGLDDDWQEDHFGLDNTDAAPGMDPDGDGQDNRFEFLAGLVPTDPASRFLVWVAEVTGQPTHRNVVFEPVSADRNYRVLRSSTLTSSSWSPLPGTPPVSDNGNQRTITDTQATEAMKFYRIEITKL